MEHQCRTILLNYSTRNKTLLDQYTLPFKKIYFSTPYVPIMILNKNSIKRGAAKQSRINSISCMATTRSDIKLWPSGCRIMHAIFKQLWL